MVVGHSAASGAADGCVPEPPPPSVEAAPPSLSPDVQVSPDVTPTVSPTVVPTASPTVTPVATPDVPPTASPTVTPVATPDVTPSVTVSPTPDVTPSVTVSPAPDASPSVSPVPTPTVTADPACVPAATVPGLVTDVTARSEIARFPVYDATGATVRDAHWLVTDAGGSCCGVFVAATPDGRLLELGGPDPVYSDDRGESWHTVVRDVPSLAGEGAISAAPNGDIVGVVADLETGDRLQAVKYDAAAETWAFAEVPLHEPLLERPWFAVVPGPFAVAEGVTVPYVTVVRSDSESGQDSAFSVSLDGLTYAATSDAPAGASFVAGLVTAYLEPASHAILDYVQPNAGSGITPLARGGFLDVRPPDDIARPPSEDIPPPGELVGCPATEYGTDMRWRCTEVPGHTFGDALVVDSRGWLHEVTATSSEVVEYRSSPDGGRTWSRLDLVLPNGAIVDPRMFDVKANGDLGLAVVAAHTFDATNSHDFVFRIDTSAAQPRLVETLRIGAGDRRSQPSTPFDDALDPRQRFDYASVALLPDGTVAVAFDDAGHDSPRLAIELPAGSVPDVPVLTPPSPTATPGVTPDASPSVAPTPTPATTPSTTPTPAPSAAPSPAPPAPRDTTAPAASAVLPVRLTDPALVRFDERVTGVSGVSLRLAGGGAVPTARRCRDGAAAVSCDGPLTEVELRPSAPLRPGERYVLAIGTEPPRDAAGNAVAATAFAFRGSLVEDQASRAASYSWRTVPERAALGGSYTVERRAGATASYAFTGTSVTWVGAAGPDQGRVDVLVDGVRRATVDTYAPAPRWRVARTVSGVAPGRHVLTLRVRGDRSARSRGTTVVLDAVRAASGTTAATPAWDAAWCTAGSPSFAGGSAAVADLAGAEVTFTFRGTGVDWVTLTAPGAGRARVYVDGRLYATVDNDSPVRRYGVRRTVSGLTDAVHRVTLRIVGDGPVAVDRWVVT